jgi:hypothetical protein
MYKIDPSTGALTHVSNDPETGLSAWAVFDPTGGFIWEVTPGPTCFACNTGVTAYQVDPDTGNMTMVPNSFLLMNSSSHACGFAFGVTSPFALKT